LIQRLFAAKEVSGNDNDHHQNPNQQLGQAPDRTLNDRALCGRNELFFVGEK
jgi:hypothetical protein